MFRCHLTEYRSSPCRYRRCNININSDKYVALIVEVKNTTFCVVCVVADVSAIAARTQYPTINSTMQMCTLSVYVMDKMKRRTRVMREFEAVRMIRGRRACRVLCARFHLVKALQKLTMLGGSKTGQTCT